MLLFFIHILVFLFINTFLMQRDLIYFIFPNVLVLLLMLVLTVFCWATKYLSQCFCRFYVTTSKSCNILIQQLQDIWRSPRFPFAHFLSIGISPYYNNRTIYIFPDFFVLEKNTMRIMIKNKMKNERTNERTNVLVAKSRYRCFHMSQFVVD